MAVNKLDGKPLLFAASTKLRVANIKPSELFQNLLMQEDQLVKLITLRLKSNFLS